MALPRMKTVSGQSADRTYTPRIEFNSAYNLQYSNPQEWQARASSPPNIPPPETVGREYDERQMPVDWDYKTATVGPNGEELPDKAIGWNPHGKPDFGSGIDGWWNHITSNFSRKREIPDNNVTLNSIVSGIKDTWNYWKTEEEAGNAPASKKFGQALLATVGGLAQGVGALWSGVEEAGPDEDGVTALNAIPRAVGAAFTTLGYGFEAIDRYVKENLVIPSAIRSEAALVQGGLVSQEKIDEWKNWIGPLGLFPLWANSAFHQITGEINLDTVKMDKALLDARLGYTAWKETATKEEFTRRVASGEDPRLLAMELQNPLTEMVGELLFDPTNVLSFGSKKILEFAGDINKLSDSAKITKKAEGFMEAIRTAAKTGNEAANVEATRFFDWLAEAARQTVKNISGEVKEAEDWGGLKGLFAKTAESRQALLTEEMSDWFHEITVLTKSPDDTFKIAESLGIMLDPDVPFKVKKAAWVQLDTALEGRAIPPHTLFGESGQRTAMVWKEIMGESRGGKLAEMMETAKDDIVKMNDLLAEEMAKVTKKIFPTVGDRIKENTKYLKLLQEGKTNEAAKLIEKIPWAKEAPNSLHANLWKAYDKFRPFYKTAGSIQGTLFMGLNPAYRMRNRMGNFAALFADSGAGAATMSLLDNRFMPWGKQWAVDTLNKWSGDVGHAAEFRGVGKTAAGAAASFDRGKWMRGTLQYFAKKASGDEAIAGTHIMARTMKRVVKRVLNRKRALEGLDDVALSPEHAKLFERLANKHAGDLSAAFREFVEKEGIDEISNLMFLDDRQMAILGHLGIEEAVREALDPSLPWEDNLARLEDIKESHRLLGSRAAGEHVLKTDPKYAETITTIEEVMGPKFSQAFEAKLHADQVMVQTAEDAVDRLMLMFENLVNNSIKKNSRLAKVDDILADNTSRLFIQESLGKIKTSMRQVMRGNPETGYKGLHQLLVEFRKDVRKLYNEASERPPVELYQAWQTRSGWMGPAPDTFDGFTIKGFKDALWNGVRGKGEGYFGRTSRLYHQGFSKQVRYALKGVEDLISAIDPDGTAELAKHLQPMIDNIYRQQNIADAMYRAMPDADGIMNMLVTPVELEDLLIEKWAEMAKLNITQNPAEYVEGVQSVRQFINNLRVNKQKGIPALNDIEDPVIRQAVAELSWTEARSKELLDVLSSEKPDDFITLDYLKERQAYLSAQEPTRELILEEIDSLNEQIAQLGDPVRYVSDPEVGDVMSVQLGDQVVEGIYKGMTPKTKKIRVEIDGQRHYFTQDQILISEEVMKKIQQYEELTKRKGLLGEQLNTLGDELDKTRKLQLDEIDRRIKDIENKPTVQRLQEEIAVLSEPEPGMIRLYQGRPATFDGTYDSVSWSQNIEQAVNFNGENARYFWIDVDEATMEAAKARAIAEGVDPRMVNLGEEVRLADNFVLKGDELNGRALRQKYKPFRAPVIAPMDEATPTISRAAHQLFPDIKKVVDHIKEAVNEAASAGPRRRIATNYTPEQIREFRKYINKAQTRVNEARSVGGKIASAERDFALHNYGDRIGLDLVAGLIFPYQFWYSRSYIKWMKRMVRQPNILSAYLRYRKTLEKLHAGMPDWWKYQLNTNEVLGLDEENPLYFNLEAMINPLNGLTNVDFTDPKRRIDWWGGAMEDMQKMGPSVWTPFVYGLAAYYSFKGEKEAAARWAGRLLPQSRAIRDLTAMFDPKGLGVEIDPAVHLWGGGSPLAFTGSDVGIEAYERGRVGRQLGMMIEEGIWKQEDIIDAAYKQSGEIWDIARARAINDRAGSLLKITAPFLFGVGLKPRRENDIQIDNMYREINNLMATRPRMSNERYSEAWQVLREAYPFMDTVLLSKKSGLLRDEALAWNVLNRIPPGKSFALAEDVHLDYDTVEQFRQNKGELANMSEADRMEFMAGVMQLDALLAIPDQMTVREWRDARLSYADLMEDGETIFGEDIWQKVDLYYAAFDENNPDAMRNFLRANPVVEEALDFKQMTINSNPGLLAYYGSAEKLEKFYKSQLYQTVEQLWGAEIWDKWSVYHQLKDMGEVKAAKKYFKDNPELKGYLELRDELEPLIEEKVSDLADQMDKPKGPFYREENTMPDPNVGVESFNVDAQQRWIEEQVMTYAQGVGDTGRFQTHTDVMDIIRTQANTTWPNTRNAAQQYYKLSGSDPAKAASMLESNPELEARIKWEYERILRIALAREFELEASAAKLAEEFESMVPQGGAESPTSFENLAPGPLQRLLNDPEGLPSQLWELLQGR
jgi:hypothetical protein